MCWNVEPEKKMCWNVEQRRRKCAGTWSRTAGFTGDVECVDVCGPDGTGGPDGFPEIFFARRGTSQPANDVFLTNDGDGTFTDRSELLVGNDADSTLELTLCDIDGQPGQDLLAGNGEPDGLWTPYRSRLFARTPPTGQWSDQALAEGFAFSHPGMTASIDCADLDGDGVIDIVLFGNTGQRNQLYKRQFQ